MCVSCLCVGCDSQAQQINEIFVPWRKTFDELKDIICNDNVRLKRSCWCFACKKECIRGPRQDTHADLDLGVLGSPCVDPGLLNQGSGWGANGYVVLTDMV